MNGMPWTAAEDERLMELRGEGLSYAQIARSMGRSQKACECRVQTIRNGGGRKGLPPAFTPWTPEDVAWLRENYAELGAQACATRLGRGTSAVKSAADRLGLSRRREARPPKPGMRRCHDCGRPTVDYRCPQCRAKFREKHHVPSGAEEVFA